MICTFALSAIATYDYDAYLGWRGDSNVRACISLNTIDDMQHKVWARVIANYTDGEIIIAYPCDVGLIVYSSYITLQYPLVITPVLYHGIVDIDAVIE